MTPHRSTPAAEVDVTVAMVRGLLESQHPDLAAAPLRAVDSGWDNAIFRLGERLAVRLPRRAAAVSLCAHEQRWLPQLAPLLPLPVPAPVRVGKPGGGYPWGWSVVPWLGGSAADISTPDRNQAERLAAFFHALHVPAPAEAPINKVRGVPLNERLSGIEERMRRLEAQTELITGQVRALWGRALQAPLDVPSTWLHGDLHAQNVLVESGTITAVIDWGDVCQGDRATDLAAVWMLLADRTAREAILQMCGAVSEATWMRARGWAILFAVVLVDTGRAGNPRHARMGARTLRRVAAGP
jgi:aminoglycoside phosphotransferase (APT) family kinase protein